MLEGVHGSGPVWLVSAIEVAVTSIMPAFSGAEEETALKAVSETI